MDALVTGIILAFIALALMGTWAFCEDLYAQVKMHRLNEALDEIAKEGTDA